MQGLLSYRSIKQATLGWLFQMVEKGLEVRFRSAVAHPIRTLLNKYCIITRFDTSHFTRYISSLRVVGQFLACKGVAQG